MRSFSLICIELGQPFLKHGGGNMIKNRKIISFSAMSLLMSMVNISYSMQSAGSGLVAKAATAMMAHAKSPVQTVVEGTKTTSEVATRAHSSGFMDISNFLPPIETVTVDPAWIAMSSGYTTAEIAATLAAGAPIGVAGVCAAYGTQKIYDKYREQKLLKGPETVYQLASLHDDPLLLSDGGNAGNGGNNGNNGNIGNNHFEKSFFKKYGRFIMPIAVAAAYQLGKTDKNSDENKLEKLIDCMQKPDRTTFGSRGDEYLLWTQKYNDNENNSKCVKFINPKGQKYFNFIRAQYYDEDKPKTPTAITFKPYMFLHNTKRNDLLAQVSRDLNAQADKNDQDYVYTYSDSPIAESIGCKPQKFYPVDAGKHGTYQCHRTYNNIGNKQQVDEISCLDQKIFEKSVRDEWIVPFSRTKKV